MSNLQFQSVKMESKAIVWARTLPSLQSLSLLMIYPVGGMSNDSHGSMGSKGRFRGDSQTYHVRTIIYNNSIFHFPNQSHNIEWGQIADHFTKHHQNTPAEPPGNFTMRLNKLTELLDTDGLDIIEDSATMKKVLVIARSRVLVKMENVKRVRQ